MAQRPLAAGVACDCDSDSDSDSDVRAVAPRPCTAGAAVWGADAGAVPQRVAGPAAPPLLRRLLASLAAQLRQPPPTRGRRPAAAAAAVSALPRPSPPPRRAPVASAHSAAPDVIYLSKCTLGFECWGIDHPHKEVKVLASGSDELHYSLCEPILHFHAV